MPHPTNSFFRFFWAAIALITVLLSGCVTTNPVEQFYTDYISKRTPEELSRSLLPYSGKTEIYTTSNVLKDGTDLQRRGYWCIGESSFDTTGGVTFDMVKAKAKAIGADVVLYGSEYLRSIDGVGSVLQYNPGRTETTNLSGTVNASAYGSNGNAYGQANYRGTATTTSMGTFSTQLVPQTYQMNRHQISFWRKVTPPILGVMADTLPNDMRAKLGRNTGLVIKLVRDDSPAFYANLLVGDILLEANGEPIGSVASFGDYVWARQGQPLELAILRGEEKKMVKLTLGTLTTPATKTGR